MPTRFEINGYDYKKGTAKKHGNGAHVYVPKDWIGKKVEIVLVEPLGDQEANRGGE